MTKPAKNRPAPPPAWIVGFDFDGLDGAPVTFLADGKQAADGAVVGQGPNVTSGSFALFPPANTDGEIRIAAPGGWYALALSTPDNGDLEIVREAQFKLVKEGA